MNFIISFFYVIVCIIITALPLHLRVTGVLESINLFKLTLAAALGTVFFLSLLAAFLPMILGIKSLKKMEF